MSNQYENTNGSNDYSEDDNIETRTSDSQLNTKIYINENINEVSKPVTATENGLMLKEDKVKLDGVEEGANKYIHPSSHLPSIITQDSDNRFTSDDEKTTWNNKASTNVVTQTENGLMISTDKAKLDGVSENANNYIHPSSHPPSIINQDISNRFVTDTEKSTWNNKASTDVATTTVNGLMAFGDKSKLDGVATNANNYVHPSSHLPSIITQDSSNRFVSDAEKTTWNGKAEGTHTHYGGSYTAPTISAVEFTNYGGTFVPLGYKKNDIGEIVIRGMLKITGTPATNTIIFTLPTSMKPTYHQPFNCRTNSGTARIDVNVNGELLWHSGTPIDPAWVSISIRFELI